MRRWVALGAFIGHVFSYSERRPIKLKATDFKKHWIANNSKTIDNARGYPAVGGQTRIIWISASPTESP